MYEEIEMLAKRARAASVRLAQTSDDERNGTLRAMAQALRESAPAVLKANAADVAAAREKGTKESLIDRLLLTDARIEDMAAALESLAELPNPLGRTLEQRTLESGIRLERVSVPLGVVAVVYEARPNVTADAAGICLKSGNACILRGGSMAARSCAAIARVLSAAAEQAGMPEGSIGIVASTDRAATDVLMGLHGLIDVLVPRGGAGLIRHCVETAKIPVIETGTGNCHIYLHEGVDMQKALPIIVNAKTQRVGVCNAAESLLVDDAVADAVLPQVVKTLHEHGVFIHGDAMTCAAAAAAGLAEGADYVPATEQDWGREYLALEMSVKVVADEDEAISHINRYGTGHSEAIVTEDVQAGERFLREVDASSVYVNASTRFTDGGEFGLGAEIGISTQKLHARGPFAAEALTTYKYEIRGCGQTRP